MEINVVGAFLVAAEAVRRMSTARGGTGGVLVNVSSRAAVLGSPGEYVDYAASKAAVDAMTVGLAKEVAAEGIRVVGVRPGLIDTEIHEPGRLERIGHTPPLGRPGTADEVAATIAWLISDEASYITGPRSTSAEADDRAPADGRRCRRGRTRRGRWRCCAVGRVSPVRPRRRRAFSAVTPCRLLDTREDPPGRLPDRGVVTVTVAGTCGVPPTPPLRRSR